MTPEPTPDAPGLPELLPCPFCGSTNLHHFEHCEGHESYGFQCGKCWMTGPQFASKLEAVAAWNAREACKPEEAKAWAVYGTSDEFGPVMLNEYVGSMQVIRNRVMEAARREGFSGNFVERMAELGWWVEPLFHRHGAGDGEALKSSGTLLSNIAFNLAQDDRLPPEIRHSLDDARKRWDTAIDAAMHAPGGATGEQ